MLSKRCVETLIDLVEIKLGYLEVHDRDDARQRRTLEQCRHELQAMSRRGPAAEGAAVLDLGDRRRAQSAV